jgi:hypothetical protein
MLREGGPGPDRLRRCRIDGTFSPGDRLPCGFTAVTVPDSKSPGETALYHAPRKLLVLGDAIGGIIVLPPTCTPVTS